VLLPLLVTVGGVLYYSDRDVCLLLVFWMLGCCGCCTDLSSDEYQFRKWQLLEEKEQHAKLQQHREQYQA
jgi:hypothetical protein